jgi:hypothetical protein
MTSQIQASVNRIGTSEIAELVDRKMNAPEYLQRHHRRCYVHEKILKSSALRMFESAFGCRGFCTCDRCKRHHSLQPSPSSPITGSRSLCNSNRESFNSGGADDFTALCSQNGENTTIGKPIGLILKIKACSLHPTMLAAIDSYQPTTIERQI